MWDYITKLSVTWLRRRWHEPTSLVIILALITLAFLTLHSAIKLDTLTPPRLVALAIILALVLGLWLWTTRVPRARGGTIGFVVAVGSETEAARERITQDLVVTLRDLVQGAPPPAVFSFLVFPEHHVRKIVSMDDAARYAEKSRAHFMIYGRARVRKLNGKDHHVLDINGLVRHRPLSKDVARQFSKEFSEVLPRKFRFPFENDLLAFEVTAEWIASVSEYIIGMAALLSGALDYAQALFERLRARVGAESQQANPAFRKIRQRLPVRLEEVYAAQARLRHHRWCLDRMASHIEELGAYLDLLEGTAPESYRGRILRSLWHFVNNRDTDSAISVIRKCKGKNIRDTTWRYSYAFLLAYRGDLQQALAQYQIGERIPIHAQTVMQIEDFILWILEEEPDKTDLHFCLGFVNYYLKKDATRAAEEFEAFLNATVEGKRTHSARAHARRCLSSIRDQAAQPAAPRADEH